MNNPPTLQNMASSNEEIYGIPTMRIKSQEEQAIIAAQGAQVLSWTDPQGRERLYLSPQTLHLDPAQGNKSFGPAIRGGVPVCFPQFSDRGPLMKHGFVRSRIWDTADGSELSTADSASSSLFRFADDEGTRAHWPHCFNIQLHAEIGQGQLRIRLQVDNPGDAPFSFTVALHTYLRVADIRQTSLFGLQGVMFEDATKGMQKSVQQEEALQIPDETDRVYLNPPEKLSLHEGGKPSLIIEQQGFFDTVVWNPGPEKARALPDFPDGDWLHMLCVEAACAARPVTLQPGESWTGSQVFTVPG
ncbi:D-hexose-6-phosphate mutarotase [Oxalobacteraceae bacterium R-40]|uniref:Putative glucose-6-phosphate 1-epimerase n=1 Tax=Keguizhuia sedimenti TaxID=3064264 RepID=A0ABU1BTV4_9BURK|nr:D-hexose-6-phosphate mutarotase [Oxalobacteraceae bacterium R-40]